MKGKFIVFEGLDGAGTTTQMIEVCKKLEGNNWMTCEPSPGPIGKFIRKIMHGDYGNNFDSKTMMLLFGADRSYHVEEIKMHLEEGTNVLCDRYILSSYAYQGTSEEENYLMHNINGTYLTPDFTFFIDTPVEECFKRITSRGKDLDMYESLENLQKVKNNYELYSNRFIRINGNQSIEKVTEEILNYLK